MATVKQTAKRTTSPKQRSEQHAALRAPERQKRSAARFTARRPRSPDRLTQEREQVKFIHEISLLNAKLLPSLPLPVTVWVDVPGAPVPVCVTTAATAGDRGHEQPALAPHIVFDRDELAALVLGVEADRVWRKDLLGFCFEKWRRPAVRITPSYALDGAEPDADTAAWTLGDVLHRLGATILRVDFTDREAPPSIVPRAA